MMVNATPESQPTNPSTNRTRWFSPVVIVLVCALVAAAAFATIGLGTGLNKGSPAADKQRVVQLQDDLSDARATHAVAVQRAHESAKTAKTFAASFDKMLSFAEQMEKVEQQAQAAGIQGNVALGNQLVDQFNMLLEEHNTASDDLYALQRP